MVFAARSQSVWSTGGLATSFLHYLTASGGCWDSGGLGSRLDSDLQLPGYYLQLFLPPPPAASSSVRPPAFLAPPRPRERRPASPGSPHPGAWLHEAGEGRAREVPSAPAAPGPGEKVGNSCWRLLRRARTPSGRRRRARRASAPGQAERRGRGPPGWRRGSGAAWGRGSRASVEGGGGQTRPAGRVSPLKAGSEDIAGEGAAGRPCPGPLGKARLPLLSARPPRKQSRVRVKFWWCPAPPGGPHPSPRPPIP